MKKILTHNQKILAEARDHKYRSILEFGRDIERYRSALRKGDKVASMKIETFYLGYLFAKGQYEECATGAEKLHAFFTKTQDAEFIGLNHYYIARCNMTRGHLAEAMQGLMQCLEIFATASDARPAIDAEDALGDVFFSMGFYDQALAILYKHKSMAMQMNNHIGIVVLSSKISNILRDSNRLRECEELLLEVKPMVESGVVPMPFPLPYWREWAEYYIKINKPRQALLLYEKHYSGDLSEFIHAEAYALYLHAICLRDLKKYDAAEKRCRHFIVMCQKANLRILLLTGHRVLIDILSGSKDYGAAEIELKKLKALKPEKTGLKFELMYERCSANFYEETKDDKKALLHYKKCMEIEHDIQKKDGELKLRALYQLSQEEFKSRELKEIKNQLQMKRDELEVSAIYLKQHQAMLSELDDFMKGLREDNKRKKNIFKEVHDKIKTLQLHDSDKERIEDKINSEQQQYIVQLKTKYTTLSNTEARVCSLLKSGLSSKEIAALLIIDVHTVEQHRYRIRKKLNINKGDDLMVVLNQV